MQILFIIPERKLHEYFIAFVENPIMQCILLFEIFIRVTLDLNPILKKSLLDVYRLIHFEQVHT